jgi:hypothetical protein
MRHCLSPKRLYEHPTDPVLWIRLVPLNGPESTTTVAAITAPGGTCGTESLTGGLDAAGGPIDDGDVAGRDGPVGGSADDPRMTSDATSALSALDDEELHPAVTERSAAAAPMTSIRRTCMGPLST